MPQETEEIIGAVVGRNILELRIARSMSQQQLADLCGVSRPRISEIESGRQNPTVNTVDMLANALGVTISRLLRK